MEQVRIPTEQEIEEALCQRHSARIQESLRNARVAIAGLGGLGSNVAVALARLGVGHLHLIDFDRVDLTNLNRQQYFIRHLGMYKTDALKMILREINPYLEIITDTVKMTKYNTAELIKQESIICEAFDQPEAKAMLVDTIFETYKNKKLVSGSGMAGYKNSNSIVTRRITDNFYLCGDGETEPTMENGLMAPRVAICAGHEANMIVNLILGITDI